VVSYALTLPIIETTVFMFSEPEVAYRVIGIVVFVVFLGVVYPYSMILRTDLSP
jgi:hypothetical protein